jgi:hypothetical protein
VSRLSIVLAAAVVGVSLLVSPNFRWDGGTERMPYGGDFLNEWAGGYVVRTGDRTRLYDPSYFIAIQHDERLVGFRLRADSYAPMVYPPVYYLAVSPLSALPYREAAWIWVALTLACFAATVALLAKALGNDPSLAGPAPASAPLRRIVAVAGLPLAVSFMPFAENLVSGQKATLWLVILTTTFVALRRGRPFAAGLVFGLLAVKPQLALVVPLVLLAKGERRFALGAAVTAVLAIAASLAMGWDLAVAYVRFATDTADFIRRQPAYLHRLHSLYGFFTLLAGEPTTAVRAATVVAAGLVVGLLARLFRGPLDVGSRRFLEQFSGLVLATVLLSPHLLTYDLTLLLLPIVLCGALLLCGALVPRRRRPMLWLLVAVYVACGVSPSIARATGIQLTTPILLVLLAVLAFGDAATRDVDSRPGLPA